jgi:hypothetical protein
MKNTRKTYQYDNAGNSVPYFDDRDFAIIVDYLT